MVVAPCTGRLLMDGGIIYRGLRRILKQNVHDIRFFYGLFNVVNGKAVCLRVFPAGMAKDSAAAGTAM